MFSLFFSFTGRLNRSRYWLVILVWLVIRLGVPYFYYLGHDYELESLGIEDVSMNADIWKTTSTLYMALTAVSLLSIVSASVRRLHDMNASAFWAVLHFVPGLEFIFIFIVGLIGSARGANRHGLNPNGDSNFYIDGANEEMRVRELQILSDLYDKGRLTEAEFQRAKEKILKH